MEAGVIIGAVALFVWRRAKKGFPGASGVREAAGIPVEPEPPGTPYRVYTKAFDKEMRARDVPGALWALSPDSERGFLAPSWAWLRALRDARGVFKDRGAELAELGPGIVAALQGGGGTAVSLLIDHSGSMRGERIAAAAAVAEWLAGLFEEAGVRSEILGFSTAGWHGGFARTQWRESGAPERPGRLCALMHIVYKSADEERLEQDALKVMLHPDVLRENVDGEAVAWAAARLEALPEPVKLLIVLSDGAPVDDSTLLHNGLGYLERHLVEVVNGLRAEGRIRVGAVVIAESWEDYYEPAVFAPTPRDVPRATAELIAALAAPPPPLKSGSADPAPAQEPR